VRTLLDTCAVSELRKESPHPAVARDVDALRSEELFLSVITLGEIAKGIALLRTSKRKRALSAWLQELESSYGEQILEIDRETSRIWGETTAALQMRGRVLLAADGLIAATALRHGLRLMTRNEGDFEGTGVSVLNPWKA